MTNEETDDRNLTTAQKITAAIDQHRTGGDQVLLEKAWEAAPPQNRAGLSVAFDALDQLAKGEKLDPGE